MKKRVLIDVDGTIQDYHRRCVQLATLMFGRAFRYEDCIQHHRVEHGLGLSPKETEDLYGIIHGPGFAETMPAFPGAIEAIKELYKRFDVIFVTAPARESVTWMTDRNRWLISNFGEELGSRVIYAELKHAVRGGILIDDTPKQILTWKEESPSENVGMFFDRPYNANYDGPRITNWKYAVPVISDILYGM